MIMVSYDDQSDFHQVHLLFFIQPSQKMKFDSIHITKSLT